MNNGGGSQRCALWLHQSSLLKSCRLRHTFILPFSLFIIIFNRRHNYESWRYWRWHPGFSIRFLMMKRVNSPRHIFA